jgi:hypothetical protein
MSSTSASASPRRRDVYGSGGGSGGNRGRSDGSSGSSASGSPPEPRGGSPPREELASPLPPLSRGRLGRLAAACGSTRALLFRAAAACAAARGGAADALPRLSLAQALATGRGSVTPGRAAFVQCHVTHLDAPPPSALAGTKTLLLSRNALRSLSGAPLTLLRGLTALSAAHNVIDDVGTIPFLAAAAPGLTSLSLEGNPLCELLDTRAHALAALPALRAFDGREVAPEERRAALVAVRFGERGCSAQCFAFPCGRPHSRARPILNGRIADTRLLCARAVPIARRAQVRREEAVLESALARACVAAQLEAAAAWRPVHAALRRGGAVGADTPAPQRRRAGATRRLVAMWDFQARARTLMRPHPAVRARTHAHAVSSHPAPSAPSALTELLLPSLHPLSLQGQLTRTERYTLLRALRCELARLSPGAPAAAAALLREAQEDTISDLLAHADAADAAEAAAAAEEADAEMEAYAADAVPGGAEAERVLTWRSDVIGGESGGLIGVGLFDGHNNGALDALLAAQAARGDDHVRGDGSDDDEGGAVHAPRVPPATLPHSFAPPAPAPPPAFAFSASGAAAAARGAAESRERALWRDVAALRAAAEASAAGEARLLRANAALKARLEAYQRQNGDNVAAAEAQLRQLGAAASASVAAQREALASARAADARAADAEARATAAEARAAAAVSGERAIAETAETLQRRIAATARQADAAAEAVVRRDLAELMCAKLAAKRVLRSWRRGAVAARAGRGAALRRAWRTWRFVVLRERHVRGGAEAMARIRNVFAKGACFAAFRLAVARSVAMGRLDAKRRAREAKQRVMVAWRFAVASTREARAAAAFGAWRGAAFAAAAATAPRDSIASRLAASTGHPLPPLLCSLAVAASHRRRVVAAATLRAWLRVCGAASDSRAAQATQAQALAADALRAWGAALARRRRSDAADRRADAHLWRAARGRVSRVFHAWARAARAGAGGGRGSAAAVARAQADALADSLAEAEALAAARAAAADAALTASEALAARREASLREAFQASQTRAAAAAARSAAARRDAEASAAASAAAEGAAEARAAAAERDAAAAAADDAAAAAGACAAAARAAASAETARAERDAIAADAAAREAALRGEAAQREGALRQRVEALRARVRVLHAAAPPAARAAAAVAAAAAASVAAPTPAVLARARSPPRLAPPRGSSPAPRRAADVAAAAMAAQAAAATAQRRMRSPSPSAAEQPRSPSPLHSFLRAQHRAAAAAAAAAPMPPASPATVARLQSLLARLPHGSLRAAGFVA